MRDASYYVLVLLKTCGLYTVQLRVDMSSSFSYLFAGRAFLMGVGLKFGVVMCDVLSLSTHSKFSLKLLFVVLINSKQIYINVSKHKIILFVIHF